MTAISCCWNSAATNSSGLIEIDVDLNDVRPVGETLKGFGGMANPVKLKDLYGRVERLLNKAIGRRLTSVECCLLFDEAAVTIVAEHPAQRGMRQFAADDDAASSAKDNLWQQDDQGAGGSILSAMPCVWPATCGVSHPPQQRGGAGSRYPAVPLRRTIQFALAIARSMPACSTS